MNEHEDGQNRNRSVDISRDLFCGGGSVCRDIGYSTQYRAIAYSNARDIIHECYTNAGRGTLREYEF